MLHSAKKPNRLPRRRRRNASAIGLFRRHVWRVVRGIPRGKVATYGEIAALAGRPRAARAVGRALATIPEPMARSVPWQRVVNAAGKISVRPGGTPELQRELLEREGIRFGRGNRIDLRRYRW